jgi:uncharacterized membrane protein
MGKSRLEAFSDGVLAIVLTIMVLELKVPHEISFEALLKLWPIFLSYLLSFVYIGIYWNNHHHMLHTCQKVTGSILWANLNLLFWLSLVPFSTGWLGENHFASAPTLLYGVILFLAGVSYWILQQTIIRSQGPNSLLKKAVGKDFKGYSSQGLYILAIAISFWAPYVSLAIYTSIALWWIIPDRRIEKYYA